MSVENRPEVGTISWIDLTVGPTDDIRDFYGKVVGWKATPLKMNGYDDFIMLAPTSEKAIAGVCHAKGVNKGLPAQWLIYITVENLIDSITSCNELGGKVIFGPKSMSQGIFA